MDFNNASKQQEYELIPNGTVVPLVMAVRPGSFGETGELTASKSSDAVYVSAEFTVISGEFAKRKVFDNIGVSGGKLDDSGNSIYGNMGRTRLRAILEAARNIMPDDFSQEAAVKRQVSCYTDFDGMAFLAEIGIQKGQNGYNDKNTIKLVITPDKPGYQKINLDGYVPSQSASMPPPSQMAQASSGVSVPDWAR